MQSAIASEGTPDVSSLTVGKMQSAIASEGTPERYHVQGPRPENFYKKDEDKKKNDEAKKQKSDGAGTPAMPSLTMGESNLLFLARALLQCLH